MKPEKGIFFLLFVELLAFSSVFAWQINNVNYDTMYYDVLFASNFIGTITLVIAVSFQLTYSLFSKNIRKLSFPTLFFLIIYLISAFNGAQIANFPNYVYIDIYVHLPHVLKIINLGHLIPEANYPDVYVFPFSYIYYAIFITLTNAGFFEAGTIMAIAYTIAFALTVRLVIGNFSKHITRGEITSDFNVLLSFWLLLLPFIRFGYGPRFDFAFRFHFGFLLMLQYLALSLALSTNANMFTSNILTLILLGTALIFTHPFASIFTIITLLVIAFLALLKKGASKMFRSVQLTITMLVILVITLIIQFIYVGSGSLLLQAYRYVFKWEFIPKFIETSVPVYINRSSLTLAMEIFVLTVRILWRITIVLTAFYALTLAVLASKKRKIPLIGIASITASLIIGIPLVESILYWDRALTFTGLSLTILLCDSYVLVSNEYQDVRTFIKKLLILLVILSSIISPLIIFEDRKMPTEWHGKEEAVFLETLANKIRSNTIFVGTRTGMQYTYYSVLNNEAPSSFVAFDSISATFKANIYKCSYPYAFSKRDKEFYYVDIGELILRRSLVWSSNISFIFV